MIVISLLYVMPTVSAKEKMRFLGVFSSLFFIIITQILKNINFEISMFKHILAI